MKKVGCSLNRILKAVFACEICSQWINLNFIANFVAHIVVSLIVYSSPRLYTPRLNRHPALLASFLKYVPNEELTW